MQPRLFSLTLAHANLHGQLLRPAAACNLLVIAKPHRVAINDPLVLYFPQAGYAVLVTELLTGPIDAATQVRPNRVAVARSRAETARRVASTSGRQAAATRRWRMRKVQSGFARL